MAQRYQKPARFGSLRPTYIREWREAAGLSEDELAEQMEISKSTVWRVESGKQGYTQHFLEVAAAILRCEPWDLLMRPPNRIDDEWRQEWDEIRRQLRGPERRQAILHLRAILVGRQETG